MVARWGANPLGMLWPEMDAAFLASGGGNGGSLTLPRLPVLTIAAAAIPGPLRP